MLDLLRCWFGLGSGLREISKFQCKHYAELQPRNVAVSIAKLLYAISIMYQAGRSVRVRCYCSKHAKSHQVTTAVYARHQERELALEALARTASEHTSAPTLDEIAEYASSVLDAYAVRNDSTPDQDDHPPQVLPAITAAPGLVVTTEHDRDQLHGDVDVIETVGPITADAGLVLSVHDGQEDGYSDSDNEAAAPSDNDIYAYDGELHIHLSIDSTYEVDDVGSYGSGSEQSRDAYGYAAIASGSDIRDDSSVESDAAEDDDQALFRRLSAADANHGAEISTALTEQIMPASELEYLATHEYRVSNVLLHSIYLLQWKNASRTPDRWYRILLRLGSFRIEPMSADQVRRQVERLVTFKAIAIDCCLRSCMLFFGNDSHWELCKYCGLPRYKMVRIKGKLVRRPVKVFNYIPLIPRLQLQYADRERAQVLQTYHQTTEEIGPSGLLRDFWDANHYRKLSREGLFDDSRDLALQLSTDGVAIVRQKNFSVWPVILLNYNLPPKERVKTRTILLLGVVPGPHHPKDMDSFLEPLLQEMALLRNGITSFDGYTLQNFQLKAHIVSVSGDTPAIAMVMRMKGSNARFPCQFCFMQGEYCSVARHMYYPHYEQFIQTSRSSMLRDMYRVAAADQEDLRKATGHNGIPALARLRHSLDFPLSFGQDPMHLLSNVCALMFSHWTATSTMPTPVFENPEHSYVLSSRVWEQIGNEQLACCKLLSSSTARTPRSIWVNHASYKAKEWESWLFLFSVPLLVGRLPDYCLRHWKLLRNAFSILYRQSLTRNDVLNAHRMLQEFVVDYEAIYFQQNKFRLKACTSQIHALLHLVDSVMSLGPVSCFWQFPLERYVGIMERLATSKSEINTSLTNNLIHREKITYLLLTSKDLTPFWEEEADLAHEFGPHWMVDNSQTRMFIGDSEEVETGALLRRCLQRYINYVLPEDHRVLLSGRMLLNGTVVGSKFQSGRDMDRTKHLVEIREAGNVCYASVEEFVTFYREPGQQAPAEYCALVQNLETLYAKEVGLSYIVRAGDYRCVSVSNIVRLVGVVSQDAARLQKGTWPVQSRVTSLNARWLVALDSDLIDTWLQL